MRENALNPGRSCKLRPHMLKKGGNELKSRYLVLLIISLLTLSLCGVPTFAEETMTATLFEENDFNYSDTDKSGTVTSGDYYGSFWVSIGSRGGTVTEGVSGNSDFDDMLVLTPKTETGGSGFTQAIYSLAKTDCTNYTLEFDWYAHANPNSSYPYQMVMYDSAGKNYNRLVTWSYSKPDVYVRAGHSTSKPSTDIKTFTKKTWYSMKVNFVKGTDGFTYSVYYKEKGATSWTVIEENILNNNKEQSDFGTLRFWLPEMNNQGSFMALDNFKLTGTVERPELLSVGFDDVAEGDEVDVGASVIRLNVSDDLYGVTADNVSINQHGREVAISSAEYDKTDKAVYITLGEALLSEREYEVVLKANTKVTKWTEIGTDQSLAFTTTAEEVNLPDVGQEIAELSDFAIEEEGATATGITYADFSGSIRGYDGTGYVDVTEIDDEHGTSLVLGIEKAVDTNLPRFIYGSTSGANVSYDRLTVEFDVNISTKTEATGENDSFRFVLYKSGGTTTAIKWNEKLVAGSNESDYEAGTWQSFKVTAKKQESGSFSYSVYLKNAEGEFAALCENVEAPTLTELTEIRFYAPISDATPTSMAIDNIKISTSKPAPRIDSFGYDEISVADRLSLSTKIINVNLTDSLYAVADSDISITQSGKPVLVDAVGLDTENNRILIRLADNLKEGTQYKVTLSENAEVYEGVKIGASQSKTFVTVGNDVTVKEPYFEVADSSVSVTAEVSNDTNERKELYLVASVWRGDKFVQTKLAKVNIPAGGTFAPGEEGNEGILLTQVEAGDRIEVCAWEDILGNRVLTDRIWDFTK